MPIFRLSDSVNIEFSDHDFSDPWSDSETILMLHGNAESHEVWFSLKFQNLVGESSL